jgi:hypothetical protein
MSKRKAKVGDIVMPNGYLCSDIKNEKKWTNKIGVAGIVMDYDVFGRCYCVKFSRYQSSELDFFGEEFDILVSA